MVFSAIFFVGAIITATTYYQSMDVMESNKNTRDAIKNIGGDTTEMDGKIQQDQQLLDSKVYLMSICFPVGIIFMIFGITLVMLHYRARKRDHAAQYPPATGSPPCQPYPNQPSYPGYQDQAPPQYPGYQNPPPQYPGYQNPPPQYPGYQNPPPQYPDSQNPPLHDPGTRNQSPPQYPRY